MTIKTGVLKTVTETFNIFNDGRKYNTAPQSYILSSVQAVANHPATKERISLNEAIGFYGHRARELAKKLKPTEKEVIQVDGKAVVMHTEPAIRCAGFSCDDKGNVTHTEEFLDTTDGKAALAAYESGNGGFSWALGGSNGTGRGFASVAKEFAGFDYVYQPNFIPLHRQGMLLASMQSEGNELLLASMEEQGFESDVAIKLVDSFKLAQEEETGLDDLVMANMLAREEEFNQQSQQREILLASVVESSPFLISDEQKNALLNMQTEQDAEVVSALFASMKQTDLSQFPSQFEQVKAPVVTREVPVLGGLKYEFK